MIKQKNIDKVFNLFLFTHLLIWTLVPFLTNRNLPLDTIEALAWGSNLEWGYSKHPPLSAYLSEFFYFIFGNNDWAYYLLSQICVVLSFFVIFKFSKEFFKNSYLAFLSVVVLEGIYFYNFTTPEFNVNIAQLPFWSLTIYFSWRCIKKEKLLDYIFLGLFAGLGILSKYLFIYLALGISLLFVYLIKKRKKIFLKNYLAAILTTCLVLLPHIIWLINNQFPSIEYGFSRTGGVGNFFEHFSLPLIFLAKQILLLIPFLFLIFLIVKRVKIKKKFNDSKTIFLFFSILIPILLIFITSMIFGIKIRTMWMTPFYLFFGVLGVHLFKINFNYFSIKKFIFVFSFFFFLSPILYGYISITETTKRTDFYGKQISELVKRKWDKNFSNQISIVVGDEWYAGNLSYHLESRPKWFRKLSEKQLKTINNKGVIYVGNPEILKKICPGTFGSIKPVGYCMIGEKW